jgi:hypothetical protein
MRQFYFLCFFISLNCIAYASTDNFILKLTGEKVMINPAFFKIDQNEKCIFYKVVAGTKEIKLNFNQLDYMMIRNIKFKSIKLKGSNEYKGFFVLCESFTHALIFNSVTSEEDGDVTFYEFYIIDNQNTIAEEHKFDNLKKSKSVSNRSDIYSKINFFFSGCVSFMNRLASFDNSTSENFSLEILGFFNSPNYFSCKS